MEDGEIKRLEKLLKFNKRKKKDTLPASFKTEGLDCILALYSLRHIMHSLCVCVCEFVFMYLCDMYVHLCVWGWGWG